MKSCSLLLLTSLLFSLSCSGVSPAPDAAGNAADIAVETSNADYNFGAETGTEDGSLAPEALEDVCQPACDEKDCGPDGCGGNCGKCGVLQVCLDGVCCSSQCEDKECGPDGCGGSCGHCDELAVCLDGLCCVSQCAQKECGPDGCGGSCGSCDAGEFCMFGACSAPDQDLDGVPDAADLFPQDPGFPGIALADTVYAHTSDTLYSMDVKMYNLEEVNDFQWPNDGATHKMTDIGIDRYGVLYGTSFEYLYTCHPQTAVCHLVAKLPSAFNGLTLVPAGLIDQNQDVLIGISEEGGWFRLDVEAGELVSTKLGTYGADYASAGDAYSIAGVGTFAAVHKGDIWDNYLVSVDPATGHVNEDVGPITGYVGIFGLAGWTDKAFAFDKTGDVLVIDTGTAEVKVLHETEISWWGAGVATQL